VQRTRAEADEMREVLGLMRDDTGWTLSKASSAVSVWYRYEPGEPFVTIKIRGDVEASAQVCIAMVAEFDYAHTWLGPLCEFSKVSLTKIGRINTY
jgi:hypothetical protein